MSIPSVLLLPFYFLLFTFAFHLVCPAQDGVDDVAPPPLRTVSKAELASLDAETNMKDRTKLALKLMDARLGSAEKLFGQEDYPEMFRELGGFHGLMDNSLDYLIRRDNGSNKVLDNFKRIELELRKFVPRLEAMRREVPLKYEDYIGKLIKYVRKARTKATEPLFDDRVVPNLKPQE